MRFVFATLFLITILCSGASGQAGFQPVPGFPSRQVYDLLIDKKGFLWIGHELGISRFDGTSFTHFSNPFQASLSVTDLVEDKQGRIWCHNFSAQVFYIENERMNLLEAYDYSKEEQFPRMVLCGDELVVTSQQGLFICNTGTLKSRYLLTAQGQRVSTTSLTSLGDKVIAYRTGKAPTDWYLYQPSAGLTKLEAHNVTSDERDNLVLQPGSFNDTIYGINNTGGVLKKMVLQGNSVKKIQEERIGEYLNTVTIDGDELWVHTSVSSSGGRQSIPNLNISDVVTGVDGNTWAGSLRYGLLVRDKKPSWEKISISGIDQDDYIRRISNGATTIFYSTQNGNILVADRNSGQTLYSRRFEGSGVSFVKHMGKDVYLVGTALNPYLVFPREKRSVVLDICSFTKDAAIGKDFLLFATIHGIIAFPSPLQVPGYEAWMNARTKQYTAMGFERDMGSGFIFSGLGRCEDVSYDSSRQSFLGTFKSGVYEITSKGVVPLVVSGKKIYASSLLYAQGKLLVGTYNEGLLIRKDNHITRLTVNEGLSSNTILKMRVVGNHLWLFESNAVQVVDLHTNEIIPGIDLPVLTGSTMLDVAEVGDSALISTTDAVYSIPLTAKGNRPALQSYLNYVLVNNRDTVFGSYSRLPHYKNNIHFVLSSPWYDPQKTLFFKYRLVGSGDDRWNVSNGPVVRFASLSPGLYKFESFAMFSNGERAGNTTSFEFEILKPWWEQWWLRIGVLVAVGAIYYGFYRYRLRQLQNVESIRRNISSDLHDDIGATLSSINIYTELARRQKENGEFLNLIQENTRDIIGKLDDLVWSINPKNDTCEQLFNRMRTFSDPLLAGAGIQYQIHCREDLFHLKLSTTMKRNMYLIFKETINNIVKHSGARNCNVEMFLQKGRFHMQIADDGTGFEDAYAQKNRNGLKNMQDRARQIKAQIKIESLKGQGTTIVLIANV